MCSSDLDSLLANGTTTAMYFATIHRAASLELASICLAKGQRAVVGRVAMGLGTVSVGGAADHQLDVVRAMRATSDLFRHVVILRGTPAIRAQVDPWGELGDAGRLQAALKGALDPRGTLNAGRGPV